MMRKSLIGIKASSLLVSITFVCLALFMSCNNTVHSPVAESFNKEDSVYKGAYIQKQKNGEWITLVRGKVVKRDFFIKDTILLSIEYDSTGEKALYCQYFDHGEVSRQLVFDVRLFNEYFFNLSDSLTSEKQKGFKIYSYYCKGCHSNVSKDKYLEAFRVGAMPLDSILKSNQHPTRFNGFDTTEFYYLTKFLR